MHSFIDITGIDHIYLSVTDLKTAEAFYDRVLKDVLGFRKNGFSLGEAPHIQYFNRHLGYVLRPAHQPRPHDPYAPGLHHFCLRVDGPEEVHKAAARLREVGIDASEARCHPEYAPDYWATYFTDPDGIRLEITNYRQERRDRHDHWHAEASGTPPPIEFWFDYASTYSYLSVQRIEALAAARGVAVRWRPFLLGPIFQQRGFTNSPFLLDPVRGDYMWRDMARRAARFGLPFRRPSAFPRASTLPLRVAALAAAQGSTWLPEFSRREMRQNFADDLDIGDTAQVLRALDGLVPDPAATLAEATRADNKALLRATTEVAKQRGIFGAPTFIVGDELFWGDDRLEDALDFAANKTKHYPQSTTPQEPSC